MQLCSHAFRAEMAYAVRDFGFKMSGTEKLQQRARRICIRNDGAGGEAFSALQLNSGHRVTCQRDTRYWAASSDRRAAGACGAR